MDLVVVAVRGTVVGESELEFDRTGRASAHRPGRNLAVFEDHDRGMEKTPYVFDDSGLSSIDPRLSSS